MRIGLPRPGKLPIYYSRNARGDRYYTSITVNKVLPLVG